MKNTRSGSLNALFKNQSRFQTGTASRHKKTSDQTTGGLRTKFLVRDLRIFVKRRELKTVIGKTIRPEC